jgi:hypothetical protein
MFARRTAQLRSTSVPEDPMLRSRSKQPERSARNIGISAGASKALNLQRVAGNQTALRMLSVAKSAPATAPPTEDDAEEKKPIPEQTSEPAPENTKTAPEKTETEKAPPKPDPDGQTGMVVEEQFQPLDFGVVADEHTYLSSADGDAEKPHDVEKPHKDVEEPQAPQIGFRNLGCVGTVPYEDAPIASNDHRAHAFTNGGQTGTIAWAGGGGAGPHANEGVGTVQNLVNPVYEAKSNKDTKDADASVRAGTGKADVTRSYLGARTGDQGNGHFVTAAAAARLNAHEVLHINSTQGHYNTHIKPMLERVADHSLGLNIASSEAAAIAALKAKIKFPESITAFQTADNTDNKPNGTVDTNDKASGTYVEDRLAGNVAGKAYQHRICTPGEPTPAP